jgi:hypothetical protein
LLFGNVNGNPETKADPMHKVIQTGAAAKPGGRMTGKEQKVLLDQSLMTLQDKNPVIAKQSADLLFSDITWFSEHQGKDKRQIYLQMTSPAVRDRMMALEKDSPGASDMYVSWLQKAAQPMFRQSAHELQSAITGGQHNITVDPETLNMTIAVKPEVLGARTPAQAAAWNKDQNDQTYVQQFNQVVNTLMPTFEAKYGKEGAKQAMGVFLQQANVDFNAPQRGGVFSIIGEAIKGFDAKVQDQIEGAKPGPVNVDPHGRLKKSTDFSGKKGMFKTEDSSRIEGTQLAKTIDDRESLGGRYDVALGGRKVPFTEMSIDQVLDWQKQDKAKTGAPAAPAGRTQIIESTLRNLKKDMGLKGTELFDEGMQDQMRDVLLEKRGLNKFLDGEITAKQFVANLRKEWDGLNKSSDRELLQAVMELSVSLGKQRPAGR